MEFNINPALFSTEQNFKPLDNNKIYDVLIIGGGPAGFTAAVYSMRKGLSTAVLVKHIGGQVAETAGIENYMGYRYIDGLDLVDKFRDQVLQFGMDFESEIEVTAIEDGNPKLVHLSDGRVFRSHTIIVASGKQSKRLNIPGERELTGHGVAYCAICDAPLYKRKKVIVVGGGNSGLGAAIDLAKGSSHVTLLHRWSQLKGDKILIDKLNTYDNVDYLFEHEVLAVNGTEIVSGVEVLDKKTSEVRTIALDGVFVQIGLEPNSQFVKGLLELNEFNEIVVDSFGRTNIPGIFAAGDVTNIPYKQIITACGEGAKAALTASEYIMKLQEVYDGAEV